MAEYIRELLAETDLDVTMRADLPAPPVMPPLGEHQVRPHGDDAAIAEDSAYGEVVCFCERVTRGEIRDAMTSTIPPNSIQGLRRRTRAMNGRCQAFYCGARVKQLFDRYQEQGHE